MSTKMIARGIVGSLRLVGVSAAVAVGIAGFATVGASPAAAAPAEVSAASFKLTDQQGAALSKLVSKVELPKFQLKVKTCTNMQNANVPTDVLLKLGCIVIPEGGGEIIGGPIFS